LAYDQTNDYSFDSGLTKDPGENNKITAYVKGALKYGIEPVVTVKTPPPGYRISGYIQPDLSIPSSSSAKLKQGFKVELLADGKYAITNQNGYFEISGVSETKNHVLGITKENY
jgi:hypothetical protein